MNAVEMSRMMGVIRRISREDERYQIEAARDAISEKLDDLGILPYFYTFGGSTHAGPGGITVCLFTVPADITLRVVGLWGTGAFALTVGDASVVARGVSIRGPFDSNWPLLGEVWAARRALRAVNSGGNTDRLIPLRPVFNEKANKKRLCQDMLSAYLAFVPSHYPSLMKLELGDALPVDAPAVYKGMYMPTTFGNYDVADLERQTLEG